MPLHYMAPLLIIIMPITFFDIFAIIIDAAADRHYWLFTIAAAMMMCYAFIDIFAYYYAMPYIITLLYWAPWCAHYRLICHYY